MNAFPISSMPVSPIVVERLGWVLVHSLWQFALMALLAGLVVRVLCRHSATARYAVLGIAMLGTIVIPASTWTILPDTLPDRSELRAVTAVEHEVVPTIDALLQEHERLFPDGPIEAGPELGGLAIDHGTAVVVTDQADLVELPALISPGNVDVEASLSERVRTALQPCLAWIVGGWCVGVLLCSARPLLGWYMLRRLRRVGVSPVSDEVLASLRQVSDRLGMGHATRVLYSTLAKVPVVVGYFRPVILLPVSLMTNIPASQLEAILAHELVHVRRHDFVVNLLQTLVETLFFYHPAVWWLSSRLRAERENCCDDLVVEALGNRVEYGRALLAIEELRGRDNVLAIGAGDGSLLTRVRRIVGSPLESSRSPWSVLSLVVCCCVAVAAMSIFGWNGLVDDAAGQEPDTKVTAETVPDNDEDQAADKTPPPPQVGRGEGLEHVVWSHDSKQAFGTGDFNTLVLWNENKSEWVPTSFQMSHHANSIAASMKSPLVVVGTNAGTAEVWDAVTRERLCELRSSPRYSVYAVAISADDRLVAACGTDGTVAVFDRASKELIVRLGEKAEARMSSLAFSPDGKTLAAMDRYGVLVLWSVPQGERLAEWENVGGESYSVCWSPDGSRLAVNGWGKVTLITAKNGSQPQVVIAPDEAVSRSPELDDSGPGRSGIAPGGFTFASRTAISSDIRMAASIAPDASLLIWDLATRKIVQSLPAPADEVLSKDSAENGLRNLKFSPDGQRLGCTTIRGDVVFWQLAQAQAPRGPNGAVGAAAATAAAANSWGSVRSGLRARVVPVLSSMSEDAIDPAQRVTKFEKAEDVAFAIELENVSDEPIKLLDTRYGNSFGDSSGKANSDWYGQFLFSIDVLDRDGKVVERPDIEVVSLDGILGSVGVATVEPGSTHRFLLRPSKWLSLYRRRFEPGNHRVAVRYHGMPPRVVKRIKEYKPESPVFEAVAGDIVTPPVAFEVLPEPQIAARSERPDRRVTNDIVWGEPTNGLRAAMSFAPSMASHGHGDKPDLNMHVQNVSEEPITMASHLWMSELAAQVKDEQGESMQVGRAFYSGMTPVVRVTLKPQQIAVFGAGNIGLAVTQERAGNFKHVTHRTLVAPAGKYTMQLAQRFGSSFLMKDGKGKVLAPLPGDFVGEVKTGVTPFEINNETIDCSIVDAVTGQPIRDTTTSFHFIRPKTADTEETTVSVMVWGPKGSGQIYFQIPEKVMQLADREELEVRWGTGNHPDYENYSPDEHILLKPFFNEGTQAARETLGTIKLTPKKKVGAEAETRVGNAADAPEDTPRTEADDVVVSWVQRGSVKFGGIEPRVLLVIRKDGSAVVPANHRERESRTKLSHDDVSDLLKRLIDDCDIETIQGPWFNGKPNLWDGSQDTLFVRRGDKTIRVTCEYGWPSSSDQTDLNIRQFGAASVVVHRIKSLIRAGGREAVAKALPIANRSLQEHFPKVELLTVDDFRWGEIFRKGHRRLTFHRERQVQGEPENVRVEVLVPDEGDARPGDVTVNKQRVRAAALNVKTADSNSEPRVPAKPDTGTFRGVVTLVGAQPKLPLLDLGPRGQYAVGARQLPDESLLFGEKGGIANVVVYLRKSPATWTPTSPPAEPVVIKASNGRFSPRIAVLQVGQELKLKNAMNVAVIFHSHSIFGSPFNVLVSPGKARTIEAADFKAEPVPDHVTCDIYPWMQSWITTLDHPFVAVTDQDGRFEIADLPPGDHEFLVWHERGGFLERKLPVRITTGEATERSLKYGYDKVTSGFVKPDDDP